MFDIVADNVSLCSHLNREIAVPKGSKAHSER